MSFIISFYPLTVLLLYPMIPESFRWFLSKERPSDAIRSLNQFMSNDPISDDVVKTIWKKSEVNKTSTSYSMFNLFSQRHIRLTTLKLALIWFSITMTYYVLSLGRLPGYLPSNNVLNGLMEKG